MKNKPVSETAIIAAAVRAKHRLYDHPVIFDDPWAIKLTSPFWRFVCRHGVLAAYIFDRVLGDLRPVQASVLCRARFTEDALESLLDENIRDYIVFGAGLDSFALRRPERVEKFRVWELDAPATQEYKLNILKKHHADHPDNLHYVPIDFEYQNFQDALAKGGFVRNAPAFISIMGLSYYIQKALFLRMMAEIANFFGRGTQIVLDIRIPRHLVDSRDLARFEKIERFTARRGEQLITQFDPECFSETLREQGFELCEALSAKMQYERYFKGRQDGLCPSPEIQLFRFRIPL